MTSEGTFLENWKKSNVVLIHKRESKILSRLPVGLLLIFSKFFEKLVFNTLFNFFFKNKLFTTCKFDLIPGHSCASQLISFMYEIYESLDCPTPTNMRSAFLDACKVFDKVWHEGLIFKLKTYPTNTPRGFHVETTWKRPLPRRFSVEFTWCVCWVWCSR